MASPGMSEPAVPRGGFSSMDCTTTMQISTQMPQGSVDGTWIEGNNASLFTSSGFCEDSTFAVTIHSIMLAVSFCGLVANGLVLWLLGFCIKRNPFSVYILNLAGADFFYLCCQTVRSITLVSHDFWAIHTPLMMTLTFFFYTLGLSLLTTISIERCLSVLFPIWYRCRRPKCTSATVCFLLWTFYLLGNLLEGDACGFLVLLPYSSIIPCLAWDIFFVTLILFLVCLLCVSSLTLLLKFQCHARRRRPSKLYLLILFTVLVFLLCGLPLGIYWFLLIWLTNARCNFFVFQLLSCVNSSTNPLIYFFLGRFRQKRGEPLRVILHRALKDEAEVAEDKEISPTEIKEMSA